MNKTNEKIMKKQIQFMLKVNNLTCLQNDIESLIDDQGIEKVFNNVYNILISFGNTVSKRDAISKIIQKRFSD